METTPVATPRQLSGAMPGQLFPLAFNLLKFFIFLALVFKCYYICSSIVRRCGSDRPLPKSFIAFRQLYFGALNLASVS